MNGEIELIPGELGESMDSKVWNDFLENWYKEILPILLAQERRLALCQPTRFHGCVLA